MNTKIIAGILGLGLVFGLTWYVMNGEEVTEHATAEEHHEDDAVKGYEIYPGDVAEKIAMNEDVILLDVRTSEEYEEIHLENALLLPVQVLSQQSLTDIGLGEGAKDKEILIYCRSGNRSKTAYDIMTSLGYTNIKSVAGGMIHWEEDNYPYSESGAYDSSVAQVPVENEEANGPEIIVDRDLHNFGVITQYGGTVETTFVVNNTGTEVLEIGTLTTSCSCTSASVESSSVKPGESTVLSVVFDPDFHEEPLDEFKRTVFIPTNDLNNPELEVAIQVDIAEGE